MCDLPASFFYHNLCSRCIDVSTLQSVHAGDFIVCLNDNCHWAALKANSRSSFRILYLFWFHFVTITDYYWHFFCGFSCSVLCEPAVWVAHSLDFLLSYESFILVRVWFTLGQVAPQLHSSLFCCSCGCLPCSAVQAFILYCWYC